MSNLPPEISLRPSVARVGIASGDTQVDSYFGIICNREVPGLADAQRFVRADCSLFARRFPEGTFPLEVCARSLIAGRFSERSIVTQTAVY